MYKTKYKYRFEYYFLITYDTVSDKGWKLGARRHKINYNFFSIGDPFKKVW